MKYYLKIGFFILVGIALDRATKRAFYDMKRGQDLWILEPVFNKGISRGIAVYLPVVIAISFVGIAIFFWLWRAKKLNDLTFILFFAGTIGNLADRLFLSGVRDFISIGSFPVFNLADCFLTVAVLLLFLSEIFPCNCNKKA